MPIKVRSWVNQIKEYGIVAPSTAREPISFENDHLVWQPVGRMNHSIDAGFGNFIARGKARWSFLNHIAVRFYQKWATAHLAGFDAGAASGWLPIQLITSVTSHLAGTLLRLGYCVVARGNPWAAALDPNRPN